MSQEITDKRKYKKAVIQIDSFGLIEGLNNAKKGEIFSAVKSYAKSENPELSTPQMKAIWSAFKPYIKLI